MTPIEREPPLEAGFDLAIARCMVASGLTFACATVSDQLAPATMAALERMLDDDERAVYQGITEPADRRSFVAVRGLLRIELSFHLALPPQDWQYVPRPGRAARDPDAARSHGQVSLQPLAHARHGGLRGHRRQRRPLPGSGDRRRVDAPHAPHGQAGRAALRPRRGGGPARAAPGRAAAAVLLAVDPARGLGQGALSADRQAIPGDDQAIFTFDESGNVPQRHLRRRSGRQAGPLVLLAARPGRRPRPVPGRAPAHSC